MAPSLTNEPTYSHLIATKLHPTFGAEISGVDFTTPLADETFAEILAAINKVRLHYV